MSAVSWVRAAPLVRACEIATGVVLAWAGLAKIGDPGAFAAQIHNFRILPVALDNLVAMTLPWIEIVVALCLIARVRSREAGRLALALLVVFTVAIVAAVTRGLDIECGCFGTADAAHVGWRKIAENLGLIAVATVAALGPRGAESRAESSAARLEAGDAAL